MADGLRQSRRPSRGTCQFHSKHGSQSRNLRLECGHRHTGYGGDVRLALARGKVIKQAPLVRRCYCTNLRDEFMMDGGFRGTFKHEVKRPWENPLPENSLSVPVLLCAIGAKIAKPAL